MENREEVKNDSPWGDFDLTALGEFTELIDSSGSDIQEEVVTKDESESSNNDGEFPFTMEVDKEEEEVNTSVSGVEKSTEGPSSQNIVTDAKSSPLTPYAKLLVEEGILQDFNVDEFDGSADGLVDAFRQQVKRHVDEYKETLDPRIKWLQDNIEEGVSLEALLNIDKERIEFSKITPDILAEREDLQKQIVRDYLKKTTTGWSEARIEREINRLSDVGELENDSKEIFEELKKLNIKEEELLKQQAKQEQEQRVKQQQEILDNFKKKLEGLKEIIPGTEVSKMTKEKIFKTLTTPVAYDQQGYPLNAIAKARMDNPLEFETNLAYIFEITNGFKDWSSLLNTGKKKAIKEFEDAAARLDIQRSGFLKEDIVDTARKNDILESMKVFGRRT